MRVWRVGSLMSFVDWGWDGEHVIFSGGKEGEGSSGGGEGAGGCISSRARMSGFLSS